MRTPATFGHVLCVAARTYVSFQGALLGLVALYTTLWRSVGHSGTPDFAGGYVALSGLGAVVIGLGLWVQYLRGDLDVYEVRRKRR